MKLSNLTRRGKLRAVMHKSTAAMMVCGALGIQSVPAQAEEIQLSFITGFTFSGEIGDVVMYGVQNFIREFNERAEGLAQINVVGGPEVVAPFDQLSALQTGQFDMMSSSSLYFGETEGMNFIHYMSAEDQVALMADGGREIMQESIEDTAGVSFVMLSFPGLPFHIWSREEIATLEDAQNVKVRAFPAVSGQLADRLGMVPTNIPVGEVYSSLRSGVLDAALRAMEAVYITGEVEFVPHYTDAHICMCQGQVFVATPVWEALPDEVKDLMFEVAAETERDTLEHLTQIVDGIRVAIEQEYGTTGTVTSPELRQVLAVDIPATNVRSALNAASNPDEIIEHFRFEELLGN